MGVATRDFIPQEEGMTEYERAAQARGKMIRTGANHQDFIADPNDPIRQRYVEMERQKDEDIAKLVKMGDGKPKV